MRQINAANLHISKRGNAGFEPATAAIEEIAFRLNKRLVERRMNQCQYPGVALQTMADAKGTHSCKGKNACKGKGGSATDGSKPQ